MHNGWDYLGQFDTGIVEAAGRKVSLKHALAHLQHHPDQHMVRCSINGITSRSTIRGLGADCEFTVRIKCVDKESRLYLTAKGKASVEELGHGPGGLLINLRIYITGISAYRMEKDGSGVDFLQPLYNDMTAAEEKRAKVITRYSSPPRIRTGYRPETNIEQGTRNIEH